MPIGDAFNQVEQQPHIYDVVRVKYLDEVWYLVLETIHYLDFVFDVINWNFSEYPLFI